MTAKPLKYFAYGSNMCSAILKGRVPSAVFHAVAWLPQHRLRFHKISKKDGSAKCDAFHTGDPWDYVFGVVFEIDPAEKPDLDKAEGLGSGYKQKVVAVYQADDERVIEATTYYATDTDEILQPYSWYKEFVLAGAREHGLPDAYVSEIEAVGAVEDPCPERARKMRAILEHFLS